MFLQVNQGQSTCSYRSTKGGAHVLTGQVSKQCQARVYLVCHLPDIAAIIRKWFGLSGHLCVKQDNKWVRQVIRIWCDHPDICQIILDICQIIPDICQIIPDICQTHIIPDIYLSCGHSVIILDICLIIRTFVWSSWTFVRSSRTFVRLISYRTFIWSCGHGVIILDICLINWTFVWSSWTFVRSSWTFIWPSRTFVRSVRTLARISSHFLD